MQGLYCIYLFFDNVNCDIKKKIWVYINAKKLISSQVSHKMMAEIFDNVS